MMSEQFRIGRGSGGMKEPERRWPDEVHEYMSKLFAPASPVAVEPPVDRPGDKEQMVEDFMRANGLSGAVEPHQQEAVIQYLRNKLTNHDGTPAGAYLRQWLCELTPRGAALSPAREQEAPKGPVSFWANKYLLEKSDHAVTADQLATLTSSLADAEQQLEVLRPGGLYAWKSKYEALTSSLAEFVEQCGELRNGSPNRFYAHVDSFCRAVSGPVK